MNGSSMEAAGMEAAAEPRCFAYPFLKNLPVYMTKFVGYKDRLLTIQPIRGRYPESQQPKGESFVL